MNPAMRFFPFVPCAVVLVAASASAQKAGFVPADRDAALRRTERIGQALYTADALASKGTDALLSAAGITFPAGAQGYVVLPGKKQLVFLGKTDAGVRRYAVVTLGGPSPQVRVAEEPADKTEAAMFAALLSAQAKASPMCDRPYNWILIADPDRPNWLVYFLASTTDPGEVVVGGHIRALVSKSNGKVLDVSMLSKSCLTLRRDDAPAGATTAGLTVTHPLAPIPAETHVYLSLLHALPLYVLGNSGDPWKVEGGKNHAAALMQRT